MKKKFFCGAVLVGVACFSLYAALYTPEQELDLLDRLKKLILFETKLYSALSPEQKTHLSYNPVTVKMAENTEQKYSLITQVIDNLFELNVMPLIELAIRNDFKEKKWGNPYVSYIKLPNPLNTYAVSDVPTLDEHLHESNSSSLINDTFSVMEGIRHFDQRFETYIYNLINRKGLMVIRGNYAFLDFNLNGIPDSVFFIQKYCDSKRKYWTYLTVIGEGENTLQGGSYQARYLDSLFLVLDYILKHYQFMPPADNDGTIGTQI